VAVTAHAGGALSLWELATGEELTSLAAAGAPAGALDVSADAAHMVTLEHDTLRGDAAACSFSLWCLLQPPAPHQARASASLEPEHRRRPAHPRRPPPSHPPRRARCAWGPRPRPTIRYITTFRAASGTRVD
jgi:hypothetical protein